MIIDCPVCNEKLQPSKRDLNDKQFRIALDYKCNSHLHISAYEHNQFIYMSRINFQKFSILGFNLYDLEGDLLPQGNLSLGDFFITNEWRGTTETILNNLPIFVEKAHLYLKDYLKYHAFL